MPVDVAGLVQDAYDFNNVSDLPIKNIVSPDAPSPVTDPQIV